MRVISPKGEIQYFGTPGADGSVLRNGTGTPSDSLGADGDYYLDTASGDVYERQDGAYVVVGNFMGPDGDPGDAGTNGVDGAAWWSGAGAPSNSTGVNGDWYIDTDAAEIYQKQGGIYVSMMTLIAYGQNSSWRISGNKFQLYNQTRSTFQSIYITGEEGEETLVVGETDFGSNSGWREKDGNIQLFNPTQTKYHTIFLEGESGAESINIGPGEV